MNGQNKQPLFDADQEEGLFRALLEAAPDGMVIVDESGTIVMANAQAERLFGYPRAEMLGQKVEFLVPQRFHERHVAQRNGYIAAPRTRPMGSGLDLWGRRKDDSEFPVEISLSPLQTRQGMLVSASIRDVTERRKLEASKRAAGQMKEALRREILLRREIHHRVKNSLQIIASLLFLRARSIEDPRVVEILSESRNRIISIALIHEKLYAIGSATTLELSDYIRQLVADVSQVYRATQANVVSRVETEPVKVGIDVAIPCGLIIVELVSNSLRHAFAKGGAGEIRVGFHQADGKLRLRVSDTGRGLPAGFDPTNAKTLGLSLVSDLARQLEGQVTFRSDAGTVVTVTFPQPKPEDVQGNSNDS